MIDYFHAKPKTREGQIGQRIYHAALSSQYGFRSDQIGIPPDASVWVEIFENIGRAALKAIAEGGQ